MAKYVIKKHQDQARECAFEVLTAVEEEDAYSNLALPRLLKQRGITGKDAAFATELTYGTIRQQRFYDEILQRAVGREVSELDVPVRVIARMGTHQLLSMRVPTHAAVSESVNLARQVISTGPAALINAALRRVSEKSRGDWEREVTRNADRDDRLGIMYSHPSWIVQALRSSLNADGYTDETDLQALLDANNTNPYLTLVARPGLISGEDLADEAESVLDTNVALGKWLPTAVTIQRGDPARLPSVQQGTAAVQDEGSQIVAHLLTKIRVIGEDQKWLDLCAGPGGKTAYLAAAGKPRGAFVIANEANEKRAALVEKSCRALGNVSVQIGDGRDISEDGFDRILVDAPCTGLGAVRRRPESRYRRQPSDVATLTKLQAELLDAALKVVRPGGVVMYATCSPHLAETRLIANTAAENHDVELIDLPELAAAELKLPRESKDPFLQLWTHKHGTDAMFMAAFRRR